MKLVIFLQNAWSRLYAGGTWPRESWLRALALSRSGQRLKLITDDLDECENTTPIVGAHPDSVVTPDQTHIRQVLEVRCPDVVITCGKQAEAALAGLWPGPMIALPHPASRVLTNSLYVKANGLIVAGFKRRIALRQKRGRVEITKIIEHCC